MLERLAGVAGMRGFCDWVKQFVSQWAFEVSWKGKVRQVGSLTVGMPQGSPLSPILFPA